jgi:hypothetical protein
MNKIEDNNSEGNTSNSDNVNENGKREKRTRNRPSKAERFSEEREELIKELERKMGLTEEIRGVLLYDLEHNEKLKEKIRELVPEIKKYYRTCSWGYFSKEEKKGMGNEIGLLKALYKNEGYNILTKRKTCEYEGIKKLQTELKIIK